MDPYFGHAVGGRQLRPLRASAWPRRAADAEPGKPVRLCAPGFVLPAIRPARSERARLHRTGDRDRAAGAARLQRPRVSAVHLAPRAASRRRTAAGQGAVAAVRAGHRAALEQSGINPFMGWQVPSAVIALKQGAGRLIRDVHDRGVLVLCDPRLTTKGYGKLFLASLPPMPRTRELADVQTFFAKTTTPS